jgi:hypothetical protein
MRLSSRLLRAVVCVGASVQLPYMFGKSFLLLLLHPFRHLKLLLLLIATLLLLIAVSMPPVLPVACILQWAVVSSPHPLQSSAGG